MNKLINFLEAINEYVGRAVSVIGFVLLFVVMYEVIARKIFSSPTIWGFELSYMLYGALFILGAGYTLKHKMHISIDVIYGALPKKVQGIMDIVGYIIFFFPFMGVAIYATGKFTLQSWQGLEHGQSAWAPAIYPYKTLIPIGFILLTIQGIAEFLKAFRKFKSEES
ncbi:TRAP transporter small permease subunit [Limisalsivibrio acetivorans]|uniref:TRAP transporter small permease subunit n=1 Tax=Limisalsivibrio acetivorans TaxID=1304888 RepID=UPI0003B75CF2|nr:TRAP transporter small permease subunit [Limisalsivibrio acetivorans]